MPPLRQAKSPTPTADNASPTSCRLNSGMSFAKRSAYVAPLWYAGSAVSHATASTRFVKANTYHTQSGAARRNIFTSCFDMVTFGTLSSSSVVAAVAFVVGSLAGSAAVKSRGVSRLSSPFEFCRLLPASPSSLSSALRSSGSNQTRRRRW